MGRATEKPGRAVSQHAPVPEGPARAPRPPRRPAGWRPGPGQQERGRKKRGQEKTGPENKVTADKATPTTLDQRRLAERPAAPVRMPICLTLAGNVPGDAGQPPPWAPRTRMKQHEVRSYSSAERLPRRQQLAWKLAEVATDPVAVEPAVAEMVVNRLIDDAGVAAAALRRRPVANARGQAVRHVLRPGAAVWGTCGRQGVGWRPNGRRGPTASPCGNWTSTTLSWPPSTPTPATTSRPCWPWPSTPAATAPTWCRAIATAYEVQVDLSRGISLHAHKIDHVAHLGPSVAAGLGTLLGLPTEVVYQAIGQALHTTTATRQSRKGDISSWKAYAPAFAAKVAIEAVDRAMRGETSPAPIYEGEDGVIAWLLDGPDAVTGSLCPSPGEPKRAILDHLHQGAFGRVPGPSVYRPGPAPAQEGHGPGTVRSVTIYTSHHTHYVIGTGSGDPQKFDPDASRETLDHSLPYIFAVALEDGTWDHDLVLPGPKGLTAPRPSPCGARSKRPRTPRGRTATWPARPSGAGSWSYWGRHHGRRRDRRGRCPPRGARPFGPPAYVDKFRRLAEGVMTAGRATALPRPGQRLDADAGRGPGDAPSPVPDLEARTPAGGLF